MTSRRWIIRLAAKLDGLVAQMNAAQGQAKVDAIAAVINEMNTGKLLSGLVVPP